MNAPMAPPEPQSASATILDDSPVPVAKSFLSDTKRRIAHWSGEFYEFVGNVYVKLIAERLRSDLYKWAHRQSVTRVRGDEQWEEPYRPNRNRVRDLMEALAAVTQVAVDSMPSWLEYHARPDDTIAFENGILDLPHYLAAGDMLLTRCTDRWFSTTVLPYQFNSRATCPKWLAFLHDVLSGDSELIELLQMYFGYLLTSDTSQQKALLLLGPPRSGKGTILRQLVRMIGPANCASLQLYSLAERFGLSSLLHATVAICPDAHVGRSADAVAVLEKLKSIIGEDPQPIDQKFKDVLPNVRLKVRFAIACNGLPDLPDSSAAMRSRLLIVPMRNTYEGREDRTLEASLSTETAGVFAWALEGLRKLRRAKRFPEPQASRDVLSDFSRLSSPVLGFVQDTCRLSQDSWIECDALWMHWRHYCESAGLACGSKQAFGLNLKSAVPSIERKRHSRDAGTVRFWAYDGIGLSVQGFGDTEGDE